MKPLLIICLLTLSQELPAQGIRLKTSEKLFFTGHSDIKLKQAKDSVSPKPVSYNYYDHLGAVCKWEYNFEKTTKVPLRLRLGSLQQTEYLEQKPNALKPER